MGINLDRAKWVVIVMLCIVAAASCAAGYGLAQWVR